ncbi:MAG: hypothetical protein JF606_24875 [Burkholderiales bacterium]|jgi:hypothetical protein|nr:hypothetical protein [Burkholderiales bacterium]
MNHQHRLTMACLCAALLQGLSLPLHAQPTTAELAFKSHVDQPPPGWTGPVFKLSDQYPATSPGCPSPWLKRKVDFKNARWDKAWEAYIQDIVDYVKEGQEVDLPNETGWRTAVAGSTRWFHVPWMAFDGQRGREFVHGLTNELSTSESVFRPGRGSGTHVLPGVKAVNGVDPLFETWSIGFYNPCGGASIGQQWPKSGDPDTYKDAKSRLLARGMPFPEGTVVVKILNTTADERDVPYLKGSTTWQANGHVQESPTKYSTCVRKVRDVHLVQMDLAVVDLRSPTRWVYTTLAYDGTLPGKTVWDRMKPIGVQFGSDGKTFPAVPEAKSRPLHETALSPMNIPEHYGCNKRLAGIVDQADSSCVSCHMGAYAAAPGVVQVQGTNVPAIFNYPGICTEFNKANSQYFSDYSYPSAYPGSTGEVAAAIPLDSSLQLQVAFAQYAVYKNPQLPRTCPDAGSPSTSASAPR